MLKFQSVLKCFLSEVNERCLEATYNENDHFQDATSVNEHFQDVTKVTY